MDQRQAVVLAALQKVLQADGRVLAAFLRGPAARGKADRFSDLDVDAVVDAAQFSGFFAARQAVLARVDAVLWSASLNWGDPTVSVLFPGPVLVAMRLLNAANLKGNLEGKQLFDKVGVLKERLGAPVGDETAPRRATDLESLCGQFWFAAFEGVRHLRRGALWLPLARLAEQRNHLAEVLRWRNDPERAGHRLRDIEAVLSPAEAEELAATCAAANSAEVAAALGRAAALFHQIAPDLCAAVGAAYPRTLAEEVLSLLRRELQGVSSSP